MYVDYKDLGKRIARRRRELGLKQYQVSERAELSDKYISCIETAKSIPSIDVLVRICDALETTPDALLLGAINNTDSIDYERQLVAKLSKLKPTARQLAIDMLDRFVQYEMDKDK
ncbi:MAG: helix-turn-helix transcriptional regulator [Ruminococcaceae bacterium]|nr:helix-turn-helix transcriptional regulator [Oscillospiraceae bacterium]